MSVVLKYMSKETRGKIEPIKIESERQQPETVGVSQDDIDRLWLMINRGYAADENEKEVVRDSIVSAIIQKGVNIPEKEHCKYYIDWERSGEDSDLEAGKLIIKIRIKDKLSGKELLNQEYIFEARASAVESYKAEEARREAEFEAERKAYEADYKKAFPVFVEFAAKHLNEELTKAEWERNEHGFRDLFSDVKIPEDGYWRIEEVEDRKVWRIVVFGWDKERDQSKIINILELR